MNRFAVLALAVLGGRGGRDGPPATVLIENVTLIDGTGRYLIPGLWDMHVHRAGYRERAMPLFPANGVTTIRELGSDAAVMPLVPGFSLHRELQLVVEMGLTTQGALQAATRNAAQSMNKPDQGTIEPGKVASMVLLRADPLADIGNLTAIQTVMIRGRLLERAVLDRRLRDAEADPKQ